MKISTGEPEDHPTPLPIDASMSPGVVAPTAIVPGQLSGPTYAAADTAGQQQQRLDGYEADLATAMAAGMAAELGRRQHYYTDMVQDGPADYGDAMDLTGLTYDNALPPASQPGAQPYQGDEPIA